MNNSQPKQFNIESLVLAIAIIVGFIGAIIVFNVFASGQILYYSLAIASAMVISYAIFVGIRRRKTFHFVVGLAIAGMIVTSLTIMPYTRTETVRRDTTDYMTPSFFYSGERAAYPNGTLVNISLQPNSTKTYHLDYGGELYGNTSIIQLDISTSGLLELEIGSQYGEETPPIDVYFTTLAADQRTFFWTPRDTYDYRQAILFRNLSTKSIDFTFNVTSFNLKNVDNVQTQNYLSTTQTYYLLIGILLIGLGVILNVVLHLRTNRNPIRRSESGDAVRIAHYGR